VKLVYFVTRRQSVYKASGESYSSRACKKKQCFLVVNISQNTNDQSRFVRIKTRLTTKRKRECEGRGDYIHVARG
jgi:hypothetical protein